MVGGLGAVEVRPVLAPGVQLGDAAARLLAQFLDRAELDRGGRARLGAGGDQPVALAVEAERALVRQAVDRAPRNHAERAGGDAVGAAVADVGLDVYVGIFV